MYNIKVYLNSSYNFNEGISNPHFKKVLLLHEQVVPQMPEIDSSFGVNLNNAFIEEILPQIPERDPTFGVNLNDSFIESCESGYKEKKEYWISPSDLLTGKVKLKPAFTTKYVEAVTQQGIIDFSNPHYRRLLLLHQNIVPQLSEIQSRFGDNLNDAFLETCDPVLKDIIGVESILDGPGKELWISPSDILIGKVKLKPPFTSKYIQALTHQGILEIGQKVEERIEEQHRLDKERAIAESEEVFMYMAEKLKREAVELARKLEQELHDAVVQHLKEEFKKTLEQELKELERKHKQDLVIATELGREEAKKEMNVKLEIIVVELFRRLTEQFADELLKQSKKLHQHFWYHLKQERRKLREAVEAEKKKCSENLSFLRHELHCENISNVMYVLANAKRLSECEKQAMEQNYLAKLSALEKEIEERTEIINKLAIDNDINTNKILARDALLFEIVKQFQKFVYFALKAVPTQAEFLLDVEKLMIFEFTQAVFENSVSTDNLTTKPLSLSSTATSKTVLTVSSFDMSKPMPSKESIDKCLSMDDELPAVIFNENMYVREDFRNMLSQGLEISKGNEFWTADVTDLSEKIIPIASQLQTPFKPLHPSEFYEKKPKSSACVAFSLQETKINSNCSFDANEQFLKSLDYDTQISRQWLSKTYDKNTSFISKETAMPVDKGTQFSFSRNEDNSFETARQSFLKKRKEIPKTDSKTSRQTSDQAIQTSEVEIPKTTNTVEDILADILAPIYKIDVGPRRSTFEKHRDSLTLIREQADTRRSSQIPKYSRRESKLVDARDSVILTKLRRSVVQQENVFKWESGAGKGQRDIGVQYEKIARNVAYSHIEIIPDRNEPKKSIVTFTGTPQIIPEIIRSEEPLVDKYKQHTVSQRFTEVKKSGLKVVGDPKSIDQFKPADIFTMDRMHSLGKIFKKNPSLCCLFTQVQRG